MSRNLNRFLFSISVLLALADGTLSQPVTGIRSERYTEDVGLAGNIINHIVQDKNGLIWIATMNGLSRFDGINFRTFRKNYTDSNSLFNNIVVRLAVDSLNRIWIGYGSYGLSCYDQLSGSFRHYLPDSTDKKSILPGAIDEIGIDKKGRIWLGIARKGLTLFEPGSGTFTHYGLLPFVSKERTLNGQLHYNRLSQFLFDNSDTIWMATGDGFYSFHIKTQTFRVYRFTEGPENIQAWKPDVFNTLCRMGEDDFYLAGWGTGLNHYNRKTGKWKNYLINPLQPHRGNTNIIGSIIKKDDDELWIASNDTTLCTFNIRDEKFHYLSTEQLAPARLLMKGIRTLFTDRDGDLWIGHHQGLNFMNRNKPEFTFQPYKITTSENTDYYYLSDIVTDPVSGNMFISTTFAGGLHVVDSTGRASIHPVDVMPGHEPFQLLGEILNDSKNNLWITSRDYLYQYDRSRETLVKIPQPAGDTSTRWSPFYWSIREHPDGSIYIATHRHGIYVYDPETKNYVQLFYKPGHPQSLLSNTVTGLEFDRAGRVWIAYKTEGLTCFDPRTRRFTHIQHDEKNSESPIDNNVLALHADTSGFLWIGTHTGLSRMDVSGERFVVNNFIKDQELLGIQVIDIETDYDGNVWFSHTKGLSVYSPETGELKKYNVHNGLPSLYESIGIRKGEGKELLLTTYAGYYRFNPDDIRKYRKPGRVTITGFSSGEKEILHGLELSKHGKVRLLPQDNLFTIQFISINFKSPSSLVYHYRLKGVDDTWKQIGRTGMATYTHLPGGDYVFEVKARNEAGLWSEITTLPIYIATPFFKTPWFTTLMIILFTSAIFFLYRFRVKTIEKNEALKTRFNKQLAESEMRALRAQMNPHFIFNCLNSINRYIIKNDHKTASLYLTKFAKLIRLILDNSELHEVALSQELEALKLYIDIEALRFDHKFTYQIEVDPDINTDSIHVPTMIIQPFVENAIWHGLLHKETPGRMHLRFYLQADMLVCEVEDNGVGREKAMELKSKSATTRKSLGMKITADRLAILSEKSNRQGGVTFVDMKDPSGSATGTKVIVQMPVDVE